MQSHIISLRLQSHWLISPRHTSVYEVVSQMGAMQAQDIGQAIWCVGSRMKSATKETIVNALRSWEIVRTRPMRGTLHYLAPENVRWMLDLCASKTLGWFEKRRDYLWMDSKHAEKALDIMSKALKWWKNLTRTQLGETLKEWWIPMQSQRVYHLACYAATLGLICFWAPTEKEETFVLLDEWVPADIKSLNRDEQLAKLATLYLTGHWPATADDLARRSGLSKTDCKKAISLVEDQFEFLEYNGKKYYFSGDLVSWQKKAEWKIFLLWGFDEYFLWYKDRSIVADTEHYGKLFTSNGIFFPLIVVDGKVAGVWKRAWKKDTVVFTITALPWVKLDKDAIHAEAEKYAGFWGVEKIQITD